VAFGFGEEAARAALAASGWNAEAAANSLLGQ